MEIDGCRLLNRETMMIKECIRLASLGKNIVYITTDKERIENLIGDVPNVQVIDPTNRCYHHSIVINGSTKKVTCKKCGDELDAFEVLLKQAKRSANIVFAIEHDK